MEGIKFSVFAGPLLLSGNFVYAFRSSMNWHLQAQVGLRKEFSKHLSTRNFTDSQMFGMTRQWILHCKHPLAVILSHDRWPPLRPRLYILYPLGTCVLYDDAMAVPKEEHTDFY